ncbi:MAG: hypothetical protein H6577_09880 [Lewinellaceae bacterium]|nr:hypothetical protein [Saprospiraceae bacterium]MCB9338425.1 hypothetical protein [Lewinellaceae bacterium]
MISSHQYRTSLWVLAISAIIAVAISYGVLTGPELEPHEPSTIISYSVIGVAITCILFSLAFLSFPKKNNRRADREKAESHLHQNHANGHQESTDTDTDTDTNSIREQKKIKGFRQAAMLVANIIFLLK